MNENVKISTDAPCALTKTYREPMPTRDVLLLVGLTVVFFALYFASIYWAFGCDSYTKTVERTARSGEFIGTDLYKFLRLLSVVFMLVGTYAVLVFAAIVSDEINPHCVRLILRRTMFWR